MKCIRVLSRWKYKILKLLNIHARDEALANRYVNVNKGVISKYKVRMLLHQKIIFSFTWSWRCIFKNVYGNWFIRGIYCLEIKHLTHHRRYYPQLKSILVNGNSELVTIFMMENWYYFPSFHMGAAESMSSGFRAIKLVVIHDLNFTNPLFLFLFIPHISFLNSHEYWHNKLPSVETFNFV